MKNLKAAVDAINQHGILLVYPIKNQKQPASLWSSLYPRSKMKWEWNEDSDDRVGQLWILREELSRSNQVVYAKWYQNRATFFSQSVFVDMLSYLQTAKHQWGPTASRDALDILENDSPLSTKILKAELGMQGRLSESLYNRALKPLWQNLAIVGFGEVQDSSFPSLAMGATKNIFEELWLAACKRDVKQAEQQLVKTLGVENKFWQFAQKVRKHR